MRDRSYREVVDLSVNQTLSRTLMTSGTTLLPVLALFFFGGSVLRDFSITLLVGIGFGDVLEHLHPGPARRVV